METDKVLFVFYTLTSSEGWTYDTLPEGWKWVGRGSTYPLYNKATWSGWLYNLWFTFFGKPMYEREEQFNGPETTKQATKTYLDTFFKQLQQKQVISCYKIEESFTP